MNARFGIVTTGKGTPGPDGGAAAASVLIETVARNAVSVIDIYKVGMVWPLEPNGALDFVQRQARSARHRRKTRHYREPVQRVLLRLPRP